MKIKGQNNVEYPVIKWVDAGFYPKGHKSGFHAGARCEIRDRHLRYNRKKERWEEPVILVGKKECLFSDRYQK